MNRVSFAFAAVFLTAASVQQAYAQLIRTIEFTTAFPFTVGNATVSGGTYVISSDDLDPSTLMIRGQTASVLVLTTQAKPAATPSKTEVVFERYGNAYILKSVWVAGSSVGYEMNVKSAERHLARATERPTEVRVSASPKR